MEDFIASDSVYIQKVKNKEDFITSDSVYIHNTLT